MMSLTRSSRYTYQCRCFRYLFFIVFLKVSNAAFIQSWTMTSSNSQKSNTINHRSNNSCKLPIFWATNKKSSDAFLNSLEDMDGKDPSPESLAALRESATSNVASFLSTFDNHEGNNQANDIPTKENADVTSIAPPQIKWDVYIW